jgi:hypothetical protein
MRLSRWWWTSSSLTVALACALTACPPGGESSSSSSGGARQGYAGPASPGDLVVFDIDPATTTYSVHNETTGQDVNGTYSLLTGELAGVKEVTIASDRFFAVELDDKVIASNFSVGGSTPAISFGVSSRIDNTGREAQIAGVYTWITISDQPVNGETGIKLWGLLDVRVNGTWSRWEYATATGNGATPHQDPERYTGTIPPSGAADETGTWAVQGASKERLTVTIDGHAGTFTGFAYAPGETAVFLLDLGLGHGFMMGLKNPAQAYTLSNVAGTYTFVDLWNGQSRGAGTYTIPAAGDGTYHHKGETGGVDQGYLKGISPCAHVPNTFHVESMEWGDSGTADDLSIRLVVVGGTVVMHFTFDAGRLVSYGAGVRLP